jgi:amino acid adenylation domain-containing protein
MLRRRYNSDDRIYATNQFVEFRKEEVEQSISHRFEQQVAKYSSRLAIKSRQDELTYSELNQTANRVARNIQSRIGMDDKVVALFVGLGVPEIIGFLGILKAGKAFVALPTTYPLARSSYILEDSKASLIVTDNRNQPMANELATSRIPVVNIDELDSSISDENLGLSISPDEIASIIYTSGTTGRPKGVIQNHRNLLHYVMGSTNHFHTCIYDRMAIVNSYAFIGGLLDILRCILNGAGVFAINLNEEGIINLKNWLVTEEITTIELVPTTFRAFINTLSGVEDFPKIRLMRLAGEVVYAMDVELYRKCFSAECLLANRLGSTEAGGICCYLVNKETKIEDGIVPAGYEDEDTQVLLWDDDGNNVGLNCVGEMVIKSSYLSPGYWQQPELTQAAFLPDPDGGNARLFRTGDLGLRLPNGCIIHLGRKDSQVKIRGNRVEIGEIETMLRTLDNIKEVAVAAKQDQYGSQNLVAFIVPARKSSFSTSMLRRALTERLPDYMIPSAFILLDALPHTSTGKINYNMLPVLSLERPDLDSHFVAPQNHTEQRLANIWRKILGIDSIGIEDNFFELGGNSLLAARLLVQIERAFGRKLHLAAIFQMPTIEQLAKILVEGEQSNIWSPLIPIQTDGHKRPLFFKGSINILTALALYLGSDQPVYGLVPFDLDDNPSLSPTIEQMASLYIRGLKEFCPQGPYILGGYSFDGLVAFEIAHQLKRQGQNVELLIMIDTYPSLSKKSLRYYLDRICYEIRRGQLVDVLASMIKTQLGIVATTDHDIDYRHQMKIYQATNKYALKDYYGKIIFFKSSELSDPVRNLQDTRLDWTRFAKGGLDIHQIPGDHKTMMNEPHIRDLAEKLKSYLDKI